MTTRKELQERADRLQKELDKLNKEIEEMPEEHGGRWRPECEEVYWGVEYGRPNNYRNFDQAYTDGDFAVGLCFKTKEEAEKAIRWLKARTTLMDDAGWKKPVFPDVEEWYQIRAGDDGSLDVDSDGYYYYGGPLFTTIEDAEKSLEEHEREWKTYLGVEDAEDTNALKKPSIEQRLEWLFKLTDEHDRRLTRIEDDLDISD